MKYDRNWYEKIDWKYEIKFKNNSIFFEIIYKYSFQYKSSLKHFQIQVKFSNSW